MTEHTTLFTFDFETGTASCRRCHLTEHDILTRDEAGQWHATHQRHCRPPQHPADRPGAAVLPFPGLARTTDGGA
jgi:hypothetical protein